MKFQSRKDKYKAEHDTEFRKYNTAKRKLKDHFTDNGKLPLRKWEKELESLKAEYEKENSEMKKLERDAKNFRQIALMYMSVTAAENRNQQNKQHKLERDE